MILYGCEKQWQRNTVKSEKEFFFVLSNKKKNKSDNNKKMCEWATAESAKWKWKYEQH